MLAKCLWFGVTFSTNKKRFLIANLLFGIQPEESGHQLWEYLEKEVSGRHYILIHIDCQSLLELCI